MWTPHPNSLAVALSLAAAFHADFSEQWYCVDILSKSGCKSRGVFTTKCGFRENIHGDLYDCKFDEKPIAARLLVDDGIVWISCQRLVIKVDGYSPQSATFEDAFIVIYDCKYDEETITAR